MRPLVLGHRGAPFEAPENTLAAFRAAIAQGADGVELDVRLTATGDLVVCHDATLERYTGAAVRVRGCDLLALRRYDLGLGERIATLRDVFAALPGAFVNVEVKADDGDPFELAKAVALALASPAARGARVVVSSFEPRVLAALRAIAPRVRRGLLVPDEPAEAAAVLARARDVAPHAIHPHHALCTGARVAAWRAQGLDVNVWTVDADEDVLRVARAGVSAIITNRPADALAALAAHAR